MKIRVDRDALAEAAAWTARTLPSRPPVPVLAGMHLDVAEEGSAATLTLSSFDYEVSAVMSVDVDAKEAGSILVSGRLLAEITRNLPAQPVDITTDGSKAVLTCGGARFSLLTLPLEDYPRLPDMPPRSGLIDSQTFTAAVAQVAVAAGRDDTLPVLTGVRLELNEDGLTLAATDRYRLAVRELAWKPERPSISATALVPARTLSDTAKSLTSGSDVELCLSDTSASSGEGIIGFTGGGRRTTTRLLDGEFPKYRSLFPTEFTTRAEVPTTAFIEAVRRTSLVAERGSPLRLSFSPGQVVLQAGTGDEAQAVEVVDVELVGDGMEIAFNPSYLVDGLNALGAEVARLEFTTPTKPAVLTGKPADADSADEDGTMQVTAADYRYLLMPVRLSE